MKKTNKEQLRMQMLAGIITESQYKAKLNLLKENTLNRNQDYFSKLTLLKDPNLGKDQTISAPFTSYEIGDAIAPLLDKTGIYQGDENAMFDELDSFEFWIDARMSRYDMFNKDSVTAREIFDQVYGDYLFEKNQLDEEDSMGKIGNSYPSPKKGPIGTPGNPSLTQYLQNKGVNIEKVETDTIPLDATTKRYVIKRLNEIMAEYSEEEIEELQDAGFFEQDFEEELVVEFGDDYNAVNVSPELSDFISSLAY